MEKGTSLPDTQLEVMQVIWDKGGTIMFGELSEELEDRGREWKPNTARVTREEYQQKQACILVERVFGGDTRHLISALVKQDYLTKEDYDELKAFWEKEGEGT